MRSNPALERLRYHVSGAIERGEAKPIVGIPAPVPYAVWRADRDKLQQELEQASAALRAIPGNGAGAMGLTPDSVKVSPDWQEARARFARAHNALRAFNGRSPRAYMRQAALELRGARHD